MYRVSPLTYFVGGLAGAGLSHIVIHCSASEMAIVNPPGGQTCQQYLGAYLAQAPGSLANPDSISNCRYCPLRSSNQFLSNVEISWSQRWRDFGIVWAFIVFNVIAAFTLYWFFRARSRSAKLRI